MKILFTSLYPMWHYHYVAELNYIEEHLSKGDTVTVLKCDADQECCEANPKHELAHCLRCMGIWQHGQKLLTTHINVKNLIFDEFKKSTLKLAKKRYSSISELTKQEIEGFDIGWAVYSSLVDRTLEAKPDLDLHSGIITSLIKDSYRIYKSAIKHLEDGGYDRVYIFNGRYAGARPWVRACEKARIPYFTHDRLSTPGFAIRWDCSIPHNPKGYNRRILEFWENGKNDEFVLSQATEFFEERPKGSSTGWVSYIKNQKIDELPEKWDVTKKNIVIFTSTEWEYLGVQDFLKGSLFPSQEKALLYLIKNAYEKNKNIKFYIRIHPYAATDKVRWWEAEVFRNLPNCTIIAPESKISSYSLLWACSSAVTYLSTIGVEGTYWGKPTILLGNTPYSGLDAAYEPKSWENAVELILADLPPKPRINALKYGAFMRCGGDFLSNSEAVNYYTLKFKGEVLEARYEIHKWLEECEKRIPIAGWKKDIQNIKDRWKYQGIIKKLNGDLGALEINKTDSQKII